MDNPTVSDALEVPPSSLLELMLRKGWRIEFCCGQLCIYEPDNNRLKPARFKHHRHELETQVVRLFGIVAYRYISHSVKPNRVASSKLVDGLNICFESVLETEIKYALFNVDGSLARTTAAGKRGERLPEGKFNVGKASAITLLFKKCAIPVKRLSMLCNQITSLNRYLLVGDEHPNKADRLIASSLIPLEITFAEIYKAVLEVQPSDIAFATHRHVFDKTTTSADCKRSTLPVTAAAFQENLGASNSECGKRIQGSAVTGTGPFPSNPSFGSPNKERVEDQSVDEWLEDYDRAEPIGQGPLRERGPR